MYDYERTCEFREFTDTESESNSTIDHDILDKNTLYFTNKKIIKGETIEKYVNDENNFNIPNYTICSETLLNSKSSYKTTSSVSKNPFQALTKRNSLHMNLTNCEYTPQKKEHPKEIQITNERSFNNLEITIQKSCRMNHASILNTKIDLDLEFMIPYLSHKNDYLFKMVLLDVLRQEIYGLYYSQYSLNKILHNQNDLFRLEYKYNMEVISKEDLEQIQVQSFSISSFTPFKIMISNINTKEDLFYAIDQLILISVIRYMHSDLINEYRVNFQNGQFYLTYLFQYLSKKMHDQHQVNCLFYGIIFLICDIFMHTVFHHDVENIANDFLNMIHLGKKINFQKKDDTNHDTQNLITDYMSDILGLKVNNDSSVITSNILFMSLLGVYLVSQLKPNHSYENKLINEINSYKKESVNEISWNISEIDKSSKNLFQIFRIFQRCLIRNIFGEIEVYNRRFVMSYDNNIDKSGGSGKSSFDILNQQCTLNMLTILLKNNEFAHYFKFDHEFFLPEKIINIFYFKDDEENNLTSMLNDILEKEKNEKNFNLVNIKDTIYNRLNHINANLNIMRNKLDKAIIQKKKRKENISNLINLIESQIDNMKERTTAINQVKKNLAIHRMEIDDMQLEIDQLIKEKESNVACNVMNQVAAKYIILNQNSFYGNEKYSGKFISIFQSINSTIINSSKKYKNISNNN